MPVGSGESYDRWSSAQALSLSSAQDGALHRHHADRVHEGTDEQFREANRDAWLNYTKTDPDRRPGDFPSYEQASHQQRAEAHRDAWMNYKKTEGRNDRYGRGAGLSGLMGRFSSGDLAVPWAPIRDPRANYYTSALHNAHLKSR